ncbi:MAG: CNP1-like family protein [Burkholderiales bacterium]
MNPKSWLLLWPTSRSLRRRTGAAWRACGAALLCAAGAALAQSAIPVPRYEDETRREPEVTLPRYPEERNLLRFPTNWTNAQIFVDTASLTVREDRVVLYALVVRSAGGAENVSFEALRCTSGEVRVYAYGSRAPDGGKWTLARSAAWRPIEDRGINRYRFEFWRDVFCDGRDTETRRNILLLLQRGGRERVDGIPD